MKIQKVQIPPDVKGSRKMVENMRFKIAETLSTKYPDDSHPLSSSAAVISTTGGCGNLDGLEILNRVRDHLDSMNSGRLKTAFGMIDAAAKVYAYSAE